MNKAVLEVENIKNINDSFKLEKYLTKNKKIKDVDIDIKRNLITIIYTDIDIDEIKKMLFDYGYNKVELDIITTTETKSTKLLIFFTILLVIPIFLIIANYINIPFFTKKRILLILLSFETIYIIYGFDIITNGLKNIIRGRSNLNSLLTSTIVASYIFNIYNYFSGKYNHYTEVVIFIITFQKVGTYIINRIQEKVESEIKQVSKTELTKVKSDNQEVNIYRAKVNDTVTLLPGDKALLDGIVTEGVSFFDESMVNGTSIPEVKSKSSNIIAGSINCDNEITYIVNKNHNNSFINKVKKLVLEEKNNKKDYQTRVDRFCNYFTVLINISMVLIILIGTLIKKDMYKSFELAITILISSSSFALCFITPLAIKIQNKYCRKKGILIRNTKFLENKKVINTIIFDKTATLTDGYFSVSKINNHSDLSDKELLELLGSIEKHNTHIIARGIMKYLRNEKIKDKYDFSTEHINGYGVKARDDEDIYYACNSALLEKLDINNCYKEEERKLKLDDNIVLYIVKNSKIIATIGVKDNLRKEAKKVIQSLQEKKLDVIIVSGDNETITKKIATTLGVNKVYANLSYEEKNNLVKKLLKEKKQVMYVGDGLNDAPALMSATFGVALKNSYDIPSSAADVIITNDNLNRINDILTISKKTRKCIKKNIIISLIFMFISIFLSLNIIPLKMNSLILILIMFINSLVIFENTSKLKK